MESNKFPFRYDIKLERLPNVKLNDEDKYKDLSEILSYINNVNSDIIVDRVIDSPSYLVELNDLSNVAKLASDVSSAIVDLRLEDSRVDYYVVVDPKGGSIQIINSNNLESDLVLPSDYASNLTVFVYRRINNEEVILTKKVDTMYGVQEGAFLQEDFAGIDFSIGSFEEVIN